MRAARVGAYGYPAPTTPEMDRLASQSIRFDRAYTQCSWTKPALASLFLGRPVHEHLAMFSVGRSERLLEGIQRVKIGSKDDKLAVMARGMCVPRHLTPFHSWLGGFKRAAFVNNPHLGKEFGFNRDWEQFRTYKPKPLGKQRGRGRAEEINRDVLEFIERHRGEDRYVWVHDLDVHWPYGPVEDYAELFGAGLPDGELRTLSRREFETLSRQARTDPAARARVSAMYDAGLRRFDTQLGAFLDALRRRDQFDRAAIILTTDHGEEFYEHGAFGHGNNLFGETVSIPLLLKLPGQQQGSVCGDPVSLIDVGPTVLDLAGRPPGEPLSGRSLVGVARGQAGPDRAVLSEFLLEGYEVTLVRSNWKLRQRYSQDALIAEFLGTDPPTPILEELYDLAADPGERSPLPLSDHADVAAALRAELLAQFGGQINPFARLRRELDAGRAAGYDLSLASDSFRHSDLKAQLRALGYLAGD